MLYSATNGQIVTKLYTYQYFCCSIKIKKEQKEQEKTQFLRNMFETIHKNTHKHVIHNAQTIKQWTITKVHNVGQNQPFCDCHKDQEL